MQLSKLTKAEEEAMHLLWQTGRATVSDLLALMPESERPPHSTLSSVMRILEKKGYVGHKAYGKTYEYFPIIAREDYGSRSLMDVLQNYFGGSVSRLVSHLVQQENLSAQEAEALRKRFLDDFENNPSAPK